MTEKNKDELSDMEKYEDYTCPICGGPLSYLPHSGLVSSRQFRCQGGFGFTGCGAMVMVDRSIVIKEGDKVRLKKPMWELRWRKQLTPMDILTAESNNYYQKRAPGSGVYRNTVLVSCEGYDEKVYMDANFLEVIRDNESV